MNRRNLMEEELVNVALVAEPFTGWLGGIEFLEAYLDPLLRIENVKVYVFFEKRNYRKILINYVQFFLHRLKKTEDSKGKKHIFHGRKILIDRIRTNYSNVTIIYYKRDYNKEKDLKQIINSYNIDVFFANMNTWIAELHLAPVVSYIYDFQHKYYPEYFSLDEIENRDKYFTDIIEKSDVVFAESKEVLNDVAKFYPQHSLKSVVMPYTAIPSKEWFGYKNIDISSYGLPRLYFLISNQFWVHKSHMTAFKALKKIHNLGYDNVYIVCTGQMEDHRFPEYIDNINRYLEETQMTNYVISLGVIPKIDQIRIMMESVAVIQPTLFEGNPGGGIAYNAIAMGKRIVLSDIPVNKELNEDNIYFFEAKNEESLAEKMIKCIEKDEVIKDEDTLMCFGEKRMDNLIREIMRSINLSFDNSQRVSDI